ncbi:MAG: hypothetical protein HQM03_16855 [Magnetococcales bacterium]|nr:hypothetical protein [Magnetococcales bacterium]
MDNKDIDKTMAQLMRLYPGLADFLAGKGIDCGECLASEVDTLEDVIRMYDLDLEALLVEFREISAPRSA